MPIGIGLLDEPLHTITIPGVLLILGGAVLAQRPARNGSPRHPQAACSPGPRFRPLPGLSIRDPSAGTDN